MLLLRYEQKTKYSLRQTHRLLDVVFGVAFQSTKHQFKTQITFLSNLLRYRHSTDLIKLQKYHTSEKFKKITMFKKERLHFEIRKDKLQLTTRFNLISFLRTPISTHYPLKLFGVTISDIDDLEYDDEVLDDVSEDYREPLREEIETTDTSLDSTSYLDTDSSTLDSNECTLI